MLTVAVKFRATRREYLTQGDSVEQDPATGLLVTRREDGTSEHLGVSTDESDGRDVFVMNGEGSTVARYRL